MNKESFVIEGLNGEKLLSGTVRINGAKNAALKAMAASVLFDGPVELQNVPFNRDVYTMKDILTKLGVEVVLNTGGSVSIDPSTIVSSSIDNDLASTMRASVVLTGPLLSRFGKASFASPGGCVIGARPIDQFIKGYTVMGASILEKDCVFSIEMKKGINTASITFDKITVGGTETMMMAAVLGGGVVTLNNCAKEPEIGNVATWLNECGANIRGVGTEKVIITGTKGKLLKPVKPYVAIPDRIEAGSYLLLGALCAKDLKIENCMPEHLKAVIDLLVKSGVPISTDNSSISIKNNLSPNANFESFSISTKEYPGFPTDLQAQAVVFLSAVNGLGNVVENIFEGRFKYVFDLQRMGANILIHNEKEIVVNGPNKLISNPEVKDLNAHDIRAGFAIVMAALVAKGTFTVHNVHLIDRGYESLEERLSALGANIKRVQS